MFSKVAALMGVAGLAMGIAVVPTARTWWEDWQHRSEMTAYVRAAGGAPSARAQQALADALQFNKELFEGTLRLTNEIADTRYRSILSVPGIEAIGSVIMPAIDMALAIHLGSTDDVLRKGAGHLYGSSLPVGGENTHAVFDGHSAMSTATMFTRLHDVQVGDEFEIDTVAGVAYYRVIEIHVVEPSEVTVLGIRPGRDLVSLVTCTPLKINTHRLVVTGERIPAPDPPFGDQAVSFGHFPGWPWFVAWWAAVVCTTGVVGRLWLVPRWHRQAASAAPTAGRVAGEARVSRPPHPPMRIPQVHVPALRLGGSASPIRGTP